MAITAPAQGDPTKQSFAQSVSDEFATLTSQYAGLASLGVIPNPSFEADTNANSVPDGWTFTAQAGPGTGVLVTSTSAHGAKSFKITSTGGGNGGGSLQMTDFSECSPQVPLLFGWQTKSSAAGVKNLFEVRWYSDADEADFLSTSTLWSEDTLNPTSDFVKYQVGIIPVATAKYFKIKITGCDSTDTTAGDAYFDDVTVSKCNVIATVSDTKSAASAGGASSGGAWTKHAMATEVDPFGIVSIASDVITLQPGRYNVTGYGIAYQSGAFHYRLRNTTDSATSLIGSSAYSDGTNGNSNALSIVSGNIEITKATNFEFQYYVASSKATNGLGVAGPASGESAVFAALTFERLG